MFPDPGLSANLYYADGLDRVVSDVLLPFWHEEDLGSGYLWFFRYPSGGPHLKIRVHAPEGLLAHLRAEFGKRAQSFLSSSALQESPRVCGRGKAAPALDLEDEAVHADRTLLFTTYRRTPVVLGGGSLLANDVYVALLTECLGRGCELLLDAFAPGHGGLSNSRRQGILLTVLVAGLAALWELPEERVMYLSYHRDWLVRYPVLRSQTGERKARELLARYEAEFARLDRPLRERLRKVAESRTSVGAEVAWGRALVAFYRWIARFEGDPEYDLDPFVRGPVFPTLFKVFHGMANALGLDSLNEGLVYHLLLRSLPERGAERFVLIPS